MKHVTGRGAADRHGNAFSRSVVEKVDDTKLMQNSTHSLHIGEAQDDVEHVHAYGFSNVVKKPTQKQGQQGQQGQQDQQGQGGQGGFPTQDQDRMAAEAFVTYAGSSRSHGVALVTGDRRYRLYKLEEGEVALHDDQGHQVHIKRDGIYVSAPNSKKIYMQVMADDQMPQEQNAKGGQIKQAGRQNVSFISMDKDNLTITVPGTVTINAGTVQHNATTITNGTTYLGSTPDKANKKIGIKTTLSSDGSMLMKNLALNVYSLAASDG